MNSLEWLRKASIYDCSLKKLINLTGRQYYSVVVVLPCVVGNIVPPSLPSPPSPPPSGTVPRIHQLLSALFMEFMRRLDWWSDSLYANPPVLILSNRQLQKPISHGSPDPPLSVSLTLLSCIRGYHYRLSKFPLCMRWYAVLVFPSDLLSLCNRLSSSLIRTLVELFHGWMYSILYNNTTASYSVLCW